jgi:CheY-like chemotaxis protein/two-component sensor histidine kinase
MNTQSCILIIDDNAMNLDITKDLLEHAGMYVFTAENALRGIQTMKEKQPDLVLLDLLMPHMDGFEAAQIIKADPEIQAIPLIAFTALATNEDREKALQAGCKDIILKPINTETFISTIQSHLGNIEFNELKLNSIFVKTESIKVKSFSPPQQRPHTILIIDDNPMNIDILKEATTAIGQTALRASSGLEALKLLEKEKPDLILLDIMMPEMNGYEVMDLLKKQPDTANIPVIIISALDRTEDRVQGLLNGSQDYITKPFELTEVQARVSAALRTKDLQDQLTKERNELAAVNQELNHFTTVASHDLQAPLRKIIVFSQQLQRSPYSQIGKEDQEILSRIVKSTSKMQNMIWDLLALSRARYKRKKLAFINLYTLIQEVLSDLQENIQKTNAQVEVGNMPTIEADETQVRQLIYNLLSNALLFHHPERLPAIQVSSTPLSNDRIQLTIQDNGIGFTEEQLDRIFKPFERLHGSSSPYPGNGIGLAICQKVAERHGGSITAQGIPGQGATFIVQLPLKQEYEEAMVKLQL